MNSLALIGFFSAFIVGPATSKLAAYSIRTSQIPWRGFSGLLLADLIYLSTAVLLVTKTAHLPSQILLILSVISSVLFIGYGFSLILSKKLSQDRNPQSDKNSFKDTFKISMSNMNLIAIYTGLLLQAKSQSNTGPQLAALIYMISFFFGCACLFMLAESFQNQIKKYIRPIEVLTGLFFISTSIIHFSRFL